MILKEEIYYSQKIQQIDKKNEERKFKLFKQMSYKMNYILFMYLHPIKELTTLFKDDYLPPYYLPDLLYLLIDRLID